jgi:hypothetical protein
MLVSFAISVASKYARIGAALFLFSDLALAVQLCNNLAFPFIVHAVSGALQVVGHH